jgi:ABC-2 type transport system permease protein
MKSLLKKYGTVGLLGWQDSLVYRFNALVWVLYAVLPSMTAMMVWLATYESGSGASGSGTSSTRTVGGRTLPEMLTYYLLVTALSVAITPNPEWDIAQQIRDGKITPFIVRPIGYYGYRVAQETSYQIVKTAMMLPALALLVWGFRDHLQMPSPNAAQLGLFALASLLAYGLLTQIKFLIGISAFWIAEPGGFMEIWNLLMGVLGGRLLPLSLLPSGLRFLSVALPFASLYDFPIRLLSGQARGAEIALGFAVQGAWLVVLSWCVRMAWRRGLLVYEAYGG